MAYEGSIDLISGIRPKNNGEFPLVNAKDVYVDDSKRLDASLTEINDALTYTKEWVETLTPDDRGSGMTYITFKPTGFGARSNFRLKSFTIMSSDVASYLPSKDVYAKVLDPEATAHAKAVSHPVSVTDTNTNYTFVFDESEELVYNKQYKMIFSQGAADGSPLLIFGVRVHNATEDQDIYYADFPQMKPITKWVYSYDSLVTGVNDELDSRVPTTRTINNKELSADISLSASDVGALSTGGGEMTGSIFGIRANSDNNRTISLAKIGLAPAGINRKGVGKLGVCISLQDAKEASLYIDDDGKVYINTPNGYVEVPNATAGGTLALTSDIPSVAGLAPLASPVFTGTPKAPDIGTNTTSQVATKNYVAQQVRVEEYRLPDDCFPMKYIGPYSNPTQHTINSNDGLRFEVDEDYIFVWDTTEGAISEPVCGFYKSSLKYEAIGSPNTVAITFSKNGVDTNPTANTWPVLEKDAVFVRDIRVAKEADVETAVQQIAPAFDPNRKSYNKYAQYDLCSKDGVVYQCTNEEGHYGAWNSSNWAVKNVSELFLLKTGGTLAGNLYISINGYETGEVFPLYPEYNGRMFRLCKRNAGIKIITSNSDTSLERFEFWGGFGDDQSVLSGPCSSLTPDGSAVITAKKVALDFDANTTYKPGDLAINYNYSTGGNSAELYCCTTEHTGQWDSSHFTSVDGLIQMALALKAPLASPTFTGRPIVPDIGLDAPDGQVANKKYVDTLVDTESPLVARSFTVQQQSNWTIGEGNSTNPIYFHPKYFGMNDGDLLKAIILKTRNSGLTPFTSGVYMRLKRYSDGQILGVSELTVWPDTPTTDVAFRFPQAIELTSSENYYTLDFSTTPNGSAVSFGMRLYVAPSGSPNPDFYFNTSVFVPIATAQFYSWASDIATTAFVKSETLGNSGDQTLDGSLQAIAFKSPNANGGYLSLGCEAVDAYFEYSRNGTGNVRIDIPYVSGHLALLSDTMRFSALVSYAVGDVVFYNGAFYRCKTAHTADAWNASHFAEVLGLSTVTNNVVYPTAQTPTAGDNTTKVATTAFVQNAARYTLGTPIIIDSYETDTTDPSNPVTYAEVTLADRTANDVIIEVAIDELRVTLPAAVDGKVRDLELVIIVGDGVAALAAPALVLDAAPGEGIQVLNPDGAMPEIADGTATWPGYTLLYFSEVLGTVFLVKGEQVKVITQ